MDRRAGDDHKPRKKEDDSRGRKRDKEKDTDKGKEKSKDNHVDGAEGQEMEPDQREQAAKQPHPQPRPNGTSATPRASNTRHVDHTTLNSNTTKPNERVAITGDSMT